MNYSSLIDYITSEYKDRVDITANADMKEYTSFRIGGPCDLALFPRDTDAF